MKKSLLLILTAAVLGTGCANPRHADSVARHTRVAQDEYSQVVIHRGPRFHPIPFPARIVAGSLVRDNWMHLRLVETNDGKRIRQLVIEFEPCDRGWSYYHTAFDRNGHRLNVTGLGNSAPCVGPECLYSETVAVTFPPGYLESHVHAGRGLDLKLYGRNGTRVIKVPAAYVAGFVQAVAENHGTGKH